MARIIYGIHGDGLGHYPRSKASIDHLISKGHEVLIITSGKVYNLMKKDYNTVKTQYFGSYYKKNRVAYFETIKKYFENRTKIKHDLNGRIEKIFEKFKPDLVMCDTEIFTSKIAIKKQIPTIYIANGYSVSHTQATKDFENFSDKLLAKTSAPANFWNPDNKCVKKYLILSFFKSKLKTGKKGKIIPPIIREEIIKARKQKDKNYILVYQTTNTNTKLSSILKLLPKEKFIIYGFNKNLVDKNLEFKKNSMKNNFFKDLMGAKAIIANGGFSLMSEALFLHKPILSNPLRGQLEQITNAVQLEKLGYGKYAKKITPNKIKTFLYDLDTFKKNLRKYKQKDNFIAFKAIDEEIEKILKKK